MPEWLDHHIKQTIQQNMEVAGLARDRSNVYSSRELGVSPFSWEIRNFPLPEKFSIPRFTLYDGASDPAAHLRHFTQRMSVWGDIGHLNCRVFSSSLGDLPLRWFCALPGGSILGWRQLTGSFLEKFQAHRVIPKTNQDLMAMRMRRDENITRFTKRFWTIYSQIEDANEQLAVMCFKEALLPGTELRRELVRYPVGTMKALMTRVNQFVEQEEDETRARENFGLKLQDGRFEDRPPQKDRKPFRKEERGRQTTPASPTAAPRSTSEGRMKNRPPSDAYRAVNTIFKEPIYRILTKIKTQPFFSRPQPMKSDPSARDPNKFCSYHRQKGHMTEDCVSLKSYLEKLVKEGRLKEYVKEESGHDGRSRQHRGDEDNDETAGIINVIHLAPAMAGVNQARAEARRASHNRQVLTAELEPAAKKAPADKPRI